MDTDYRDIWWERVPTAMQCVTEVRDLLQQRKSVAFDSGLGDWTDSFLHAVIRAVGEVNYGLGFDTLDLAELSDSDTITDGIADGMGIGYNTQRKISELLPELPPEGYVWILKNMTPARRTELEKLMRHIRENDAPLMFLLQKPGEEKIKGVENVTVSPTRLDLSYFAWTVLLGRFPEGMMEYAAELAVELSDGSPSECARICGKMQQCVRDPVKFCQGVAEEKVIPRVHNAQVRIFEPMIEYGRGYLIGKLGARMNNILPFDDDYGTKFNRPMEVELRNLVYYRHQLDLSPEEKELMNLLHDDRNKLSHLELLSFEDVQKLVQEAKKWG